MKPTPPLVGRGPVARRPARAPGRARRAFTLVEIMLAIAIFSMVISAIYASWSTILRATKAGDDAAAEAQRSRLTARTIQEALTSAVLFSVNTPLYVFEGGAGDDFGELSFVARLSASFPGSGYFGDQVVRRLDFTVEQAEDGVNQLVLHQSPLLQTNVTTTNDFSIVLGREVKLFSVEFWDRRTSQWLDTWVQTNQLPEMVRFALAFGKGSAKDLKPEEVTMRIVRLACLPVPQVMQAVFMPGAPGVPPPGGIVPGAPPFAPGGVGPGMGAPPGAPGMPNVGAWNWGGPNGAPMGAPGGP